MNHTHRPVAPNCALTLTMLAGGLLLALAASTRAAEQTQTLTLEPGWNAIWLEVSPLVESGEDAGLARPTDLVFTDPSITTVARPVDPAGTVEFISDPADTFNQELWAVWHRSSSSGNSLGRIAGNQAYLVLNSGSSDVTLDVTGQVRFFTPTWVAGNYNLLGFSITGSPTFAEFFGSAGESDGVHPIAKLFTLDASSGQWVSVQDTDTMTPGAAYWIFSTRNSTFSGTIAVGFDGTRALNFGTGPATLSFKDALDKDIMVNTSELTFTNVDSADHEVSLTKQFPETSGTAAESDALRLYEVVPDPGSLSFMLGTGAPVGTLPVGTVGPLTTTTITLGADRNWTTGSATRENLYRIEVELGSGGATQYFWLPVGAARNDTKNDPSGGDSFNTGLWVGQAVLDTVTSIAEEGAPEVATTSVLPVQIIIHVDHSGIPALLSHVMFMETKTADEGVPNVPVLVIDEGKIPFFQGIEERDGRLVGRRIETAAYDMPLLYDASLQPEDLLEIIAIENGYLDANNEPVTSMVTDAAVETYTLAQSSRPAGFVEEYRDTWFLTGDVGSGKTVATADGFPLRTDPFHRSNPFRHAFHPRHGVGIPIVRSISITFDETTADSILTGSYTETIDGVTNLAKPLVARGRIRLQRISTIGELQ